MQETYRICQISKKKTNRENLFRIVKTKNGEIVIDLTFKIEGRGAYLSKDKSVIELARKKNVLSRALRCQVPSSIYEDLIKLLEE